MYYGLFARQGHKFIRIDTTTGYTLDTARQRFSHLIVALLDAGVKPLLRPLPPVKLIDARVADRKYAKTPW